MSLTITHKTVTLDVPVPRKEPVTTLSLRKPNAGELRGLALTDILNMDVNSLATLVPRISQPMLTKDEVLTLDPADLVQIGGEVASFFIPKKLQVDSVNDSQASLSV